MNRLLLFLFLLCLPSFATASPAEYREKATQQQMQNPDDINAPIATLTEGILLFPQDSSLISFRGDLYCSNGKFKECRTDTLRLLELHPNSIEAHTMLCLLDDWEGADLALNNVCYQRVASMYEAKYTFTSATEYPQEFSYVLISLLGNHADAQNRKKAFLEKTAKHPQGMAFQELLDTYSHKKALADIFGLSTH